MMMVTKAKKNDVENKGDNDHDVAENEDDNYNDVRENEDDDDEVVDDENVNEHRHSPNQNSL
jgi:hypothetical protein